MLPDVVFVGPMKTGTSWLYEYFKSIDSLAVPRKVKEIFFFDQYYERGVQWYSKQFLPINGIKPVLKTIDFAPTYFNSELVIDRIYTDLPDSKIIFTLRDPLSRSWSHYMHLYRKGYVSESLSEAIVEYPQIIQASKYSYYLGLWGSRFNYDSLSVFFYEDFVHNYEGYMSELFSEMGLDMPSVLPDQNTKVNESSLPKSLFLSRIVSRITKKMRNLQIYWVVNFFKSLGLKKIIYSGGDNKKKHPQLNEENMRILKNLLSEEIFFYRDLMNGSQGF